jgi:hypothetical protein
MRCFVLCLLSGMTVAAKENLQPEFDQSLFDELADDLFSDLIAPPPQAEKTEPNESGMPLQFGGEDIADGARRNPLHEVAKEMTQVQAQLTDLDTSIETQRLQSKIVSDIDGLIRQLAGQRQQTQTRRSQSPANSPATPTPNSASSDTGQSGNASSSSTTGNSDDLEGAEGAEAAEQAERDRLLEQAWGHLPAAVQQQMRSSRPEKFLPKYSRLIEEYFKRLSEEERP